MGQVVISPGAQYDLVTPADLTRALDNQGRRFDAIIRDAIRGVKPFRVPFTSPSALVANGVFAVQGPESGFTWAIRRISITSDTAAVAVLFSRATDGTSTPPNRNFIGSITTPNFATFSKSAFLLYPTEFLVFTTAGTPGVIYGNIEVTEVPSEMIGKLLT